MFPDAPTRRSGTQSFERTMALLRLVVSAGHSGCTLTDLLLQSQLQRPTVYRMLAALQASDLVSSISVDGVRRYVPGIYCAEIAASISDPTGLRTVISPALDRISSSTGNASLLVRRVANDALCVARSLGDYPIQVLSVRVGSRQPLGVGAGGLSILADLPKADQDRTLAANARRFQTYGDLDAKLLRAMIRATRSRGYAVIGHYSVPGVIGMGLVIRNGIGALLGAVTCSSIDARMTVAAQADTIRVMRAEVDRIQRHLDPLTPQDI